MNHAALAIVLLFASPRYVHIRTQHFTIFAVESSFAASNLESIARTREQALADIARIMQTKSPNGIRLTLFPDEQTKIAATGHRGLGWAEGKVMAEVYNEKTQLDPYHELAHIVGGTVGHPPAFLDEGFAVYVSERLGADALALLGQPNVKIKAAGCKLIAEGRAIPFERLFDFTELGSSESQGPISYPQSASIVKYMIDTYGMDIFLRAYRNLHSSTKPDVRAANRAEFERLVHRSQRQFESDWRESCAGTQGP